MGDTQIVMASIGYFSVLTIILAMAGFDGGTITLPTEPGADNNAGAGEQSFVGAVVECSFAIVTLGFGGDCSQRTTSKTFAKITNIVDFAVGSAAFLFQLLTLQLPVVPKWLQAFIVVPPASALAFVGMKYIRGIGG